MFKGNLSEENINMLSALQLAYIGDSIYELYIRQKVVETRDLTPNKLHIVVSSYVNAKSQAEFLDKIYDILTYEEKDIVRRGRNAKNHHLPKNASTEEYAKATALEALVGYIYLKNNHDRLENILDKIYNIQKNE